MRFFIVVLILFIKVAAFSQTDVLIVKDSAKQKNNAEVEKEYKRLTAASDKLIFEKNYAEAEIKYEEALKLFPNRAYPKAQAEKARILNPQRQNVATKGKTFIEVHQKNEDSRFSLFVSTLLPDVDASVNIFFQK